MPETALKRFYDNNGKAIVQISCTLGFFGVVYILLYELFSGAYEEEDNGLGYHKPH